MAGQVSVIFFKFGEDNLGAQLFGGFFITGFFFTENKGRWYFLDLDLSLELLLL